MSWYARPSWRLVAQVLSDLFVISWTIGWWLIAALVTATIDLLAQPSRAVASISQRLSGELRGGADNVGSVPGVGNTLRQPLDAAAGGLEDIARSSLSQAQDIETLAFVLGWVVFLLPVLMVIALWLPVRWRFASRAMATRRYLQSGASLDLVALRALATQPMPVLAKISADPISDWRSGDPRVIRALADAELKSAGLWVPRRK